MTVRARYVVAAAIGLCAGHLLPAQEPGRLGLDKPRPAAVSPDQQLADSVARQLRESGQLRHYRVDITCRAGLVELSGVVADQGQREEAVRLAQGVQGVERVRDLMTLADGALQQTQAGAPPTDGWDRPFGLSCERFQ